MRNNYVLLIPFFLRLKTHEHLLSEEVSKVSAGQFRAALLQDDVDVEDRVACDLFRVDTQSGYIPSATTRILSQMPTFICQLLLPCLCVLTF